MSIDRYSIKAEARERMRSAEPRPYREGLFYALAAGALTVLSTLILSANLTPDVMDEYLRLFTNGRYEDAYELIGKMAPSARDYLFSFVLQLFGGIIAAGLSIFAMNTLRGKEASLWNLFDGFGRFFPLLLLVFLMRILFLFWSYFLLIPGILALYRYRLAVYLMLDNPELNAMQCILLSGRMMRGKKWELFLLDLSFIGWWLLAFLPFTFGSLFAGLAPQILGGLGSVLILAWLYPYYELSCVGFYEAVRTPVQIQPPDDEL